MLPSVNYHLIEPCNMRCKYCFARFQNVKTDILPKGHLSKEEAIDVVTQLAEIGFEKITFSGGEPLLYPWLHELIKTAKISGLTTMIITNSSLLTDAFLNENYKHLDWIAISIDSLNPKTNSEIGRVIQGNSPLSKEHYFERIQKIKQMGFGLKINTVVSSKNVNEDFSEFINTSQPNRWKIMQPLTIIGQNDDSIDEMVISEKIFFDFVQKHKNVIRKEVAVVAENSELIKGAYVMVDPAGRFFDNMEGYHRYSRPILEIGARLAIQQVKFDFSKFVRRCGIYDWKIKKTNNYETAI